MFGVGGSEEMAGRMMARLGEAGRLVDEPSDPMEPRRRPAPVASEPRAETMWMARERRRRALAPRLSRAGPGGALT